WIAWAQTVRFLQRLQSAFRLAAACQGISEPGVAECKARAQLHRFGEMPKGELGTPPSRMTEPEHQMGPWLFIIERGGGCAGRERPVRPLADRLARVQIEHGHIGPSQQSVRVGIVTVERDGPLQQLLCS